jgi:hypothetical protein
VTGRTRLADPSDRFSPRLLNKCVTFDPFRTVVPLCHQPL